jgi:DNA (cytosine-5)-methyltransferase 1
MKTFYNEIEPFCVEWMQNLMTGNVITPGYVEPKSITEITPDELEKYQRCHFFSGIGVWDYALRQAGWPDDIEVWTGSCPCQGFSCAGKRRGFDDERHLWPAWFKLIKARQPLFIFGEQVASKDALAWLDLVCDDLESEGYTVRAFDLCASGFGAPHIRQRLFWMAHAERRRITGGNIRRPGESGNEMEEQENRENIANKSCNRCKNVNRMAYSEPERRRGRGDGNQAGDGGEVQAERRSGISGGMGDSKISEIRSFNRKSEQEGQSQKQIRGSGISGGLGNAIDKGLQRQQRDEHDRDKPGRKRENETGHASATGPVNGFWSRDAEWIPCTDNTARPIECGTFPLAYIMPRSIRQIQPRIQGISGMAEFNDESLKRAKRNRIGRIKAYGNAIVAEVAIEFIKSVIEEFNL